jgi:hypothetical protein
MRNASSLAAAAFLALVVISTTACADEVDIRTDSDAKAVVPGVLQWSLSRSDKDAQPGTVEFGFGYQSPGRSMWESRTVRPLGPGQASPDDVPALQVAGVAPDQLIHGQGLVQFTVHRDAGDFRCEGSIRDSQGAGTCAYAPNPTFEASLKARGVKGALTPYEQFELAMGDMGFDYVDELKREAYATPDAATLVRAGEHGASLKQLRAMDAAGYRFGTVENFIRIRDHGVSARYVSELKGYGLTGLAVDDLVALRDHGVGTHYLEELKAAGYTGLKADDLTRLRDHGVSTGFLTDLKAAGYQRLATEDLVKLRDHGVSGGFIRKVNAGGAPLPPDELIRLREGGTP